MKGDNQQPDAGRHQANWQYQSGAQAVPADYVPAPPPSSPDSGEVIWTASEFVDHNKNSSWYAMLVGGAVLLSALIYFFTRDVISAGIVVFVAVILGISAARKPRVLQYQVNAAGLAIGDKFYPYSEFKSFSVMQEGAFSSIMLLPLKRFMPPISIYYAPEDEERIVNVVSYYLPLENRTHDFLDNLARRIRF